jgi:hypothetical protein
MAKGAAAGKTFLTGVLAKLPEGLRGEAAKIFEAVELQAAVGDGTLALEDFTRQSNDLQTRQAELDAIKADLESKESRLDTWHGELTSWYATNKDLVERGKRPVTPTTPTPAAPTPPGVLTEDAWTERMNLERASYLGFTRDQNQITREHFAKFGEIIDLEPLLRHPSIAQVGLMGVYELVHKDRLDKWKTDTTAADRAKIETEAVRKYQESQAQMPYPTPTGAGSGSPLDALTAKANPVVDSAVEHYNRLQQERNGRPGA